MRIGVKCVRVFVVYFELLNLTLGPLRTHVQSAMEMSAKEDLFAEFAALAAIKMQP